MAVTSVCLIGVDEDYGLVTGVLLFTTAIVYRNTGLDHAYRIGIVAVLGVAKARSPGSQQLEPGQLS